MSDTVCVDLIGKRGHNVILPFDVFKIIGPELSVQGSITHEYTPLLLPGNIIFAEIFSGIKRRRKTPAAVVVLSVITPVSLRS